MKPLLCHSIHGIRTVLMGVVLPFCMARLKPSFLSKHRVAVLLLGLVVQHAANASNVWLVGPAYLQMVSAIALPFSSHQLGNTEVRVQGGFWIPAGAGCTDTNYITTLKSVQENNKGLFTVLTTAQITNQPVYMWLTDDPSYTAFPGRCSLVAVQLGN